MSILSFEFLVFVAAVILVFYLTPKKARWIVLLAASTGFYLFSGWQGFVYLLAVAFITWLGGWRISRLQRLADFVQFFGFGQKSIAGCQVCFRGFEFCAASGLVFLIFCEYSKNGFAAVGDGQFACPGLLCSQAQGAFFAAADAGDVLLDTELQLLALLMQGTGSAF